LIEVGNGLGFEEFDIMGFKELEIVGFDDWAMIENIWALAGCYILPF